MSKKNYTDNITENLYKLKTFLEITPYVLEYIPDIMQTNRKCSDRLADATILLDDVLDYFEGNVLDNSEDVLINRLHNFFNGEL